MTARYIKILSLFVSKSLTHSDLAFWMMENSYSVAPMEETINRLNWRATGLQGLPENANAESIMKLLLERTGILRQPVVGQLDFAHRSFQEFFAAQAAIDAGNVNVLVDHATDDQWHGTIVLAAGLARGKAGNNLLDGLINRGDKETKFRYQLHLLATACLDTAIEYSQKTKEKIVARLTPLVPPKNFSEAASLASAGELAIPHLAASEALTDKIAASCVRTLALIGGERALDVLANYADDNRRIVQAELLHAWHRFDSNIYGRKVLSNMYKDDPFLEFRDLSSLEGLQYLENLETLYLIKCKKVVDLTPLSKLVKLTELYLVGCEQITNLEPLQTLTQLNKLDLRECKMVHDLSPLKALPNLSLLDLRSTSGTLVDNYKVLREAGLLKATLHS